MNESNEIAQLRKEIEILRRALALALPNYLQLAQDQVHQAPPAPM
jgi:hypothetical protein